MLLLYYKRANEMNGLGIGQKGQEEDTIREKAQAMFKRMFTCVK
jgi:hypothetical protein